MALTGSSWQLSVDARALSLPALATLVQPWIALPEGSTVSGALDAALTSRGNERGPQHSEIVAHLRDVAAASADGTVASDALGLDARATLEGEGPVGGGCRWTRRPASCCSRACSPISASTRCTCSRQDGAWRPEALEVQAFALRQPDVIELKGSTAFALDADPLDHACGRRDRAHPLSCRLCELHADGAGRHRLRGLASSGSAEARIVVADDALLSVDVGLDGLQFETRSADWA
ncbi:MAG: hypothetical protein QM820_39775 [Minicystis sp.]